MTRWPLVSRAVVDWIKRHDPDYLALRRAARTAIVMSGLVALCIEVIDNAQIATYAAFGSIALLMLVDFSGSLRARLQAQAWLSVMGAVLLCLGTLTSRTLLLSVLSMAIVAVVVLFSGVVSSVIAGATTSLLLVFILSTSEAVPASAIPDRLAGWGLASLVSPFALWLLWPTHSRNALRLTAATACRALAARLRADVAHWRGDGTLDDSAYHAAIENADRATDTLHRGFLTALWRPTGLSVSSRATVRLVDEILWLDTLVDQAGPPTQRAPSHRQDCQIRWSSAAILDIGADVLEDPSTRPPQLARAREKLASDLEELTQSAITRAPSAPIKDAIETSSEAPFGVASDAEIALFVDSLEPSFRAQEIGSVASLVGANIDLVSAAERRGWLDTFVGLSPGDASGRLGAARERAGAHLNRHSVWLHNSLRGAVGLALAVFIAEKTGVQHAFWVILGALSVLRSNAINTGANALRALLGTAIGFILGAALLVVIGTNDTVLWFLLPAVILLAGFAPTAISFTAGQVGFTLTLVILWNILQPIGWRVGLYRIEDIAIGCAVSVGVGLLFWPRGAAAALGATLREAYEASAAFLVAAVNHGGSSDRTGESSTSPQSERANAAAASRRLDDALRTYVGERGSKPVPLADVATLVRGVVSLRQTANAVLDLWEGNDAPDDVARSELSEEANLLERWYREFSAALADGAAIPEPMVESPTFDHLLVGSVDSDLRVSNANAATAVRLIWTKDYLGVARRLEETLVQPAVSAIRRPVTGPGEVVGVKGQAKSPPA
ncbi:MAG: FUSC family protein [Acidimicrobiales bacterium]